MLDAPSPASASEPSATAAARRPQWVGLTADECFWLAAVGVGLAAAFGPELIWMVGRWLRSEYYGHGFLIPPLAAYLMYRRREPVAEAVGVRGRRLGLAVVLVGLALHLAAVLVDVNFASGFAFIAVLWGLVCWLWGWRAARLVLFPMAYLAFMVPVDRLLIDAFASPLQLIVAQAAAGIAKALGAPVVREGVNLGLPTYLFEVAVPCSGLKSLTTMAALAALYAWALRAHFWQRLAVFAAALPLAVLANITRVTAILLVAHGLGANLAEGFVHTLSGVLVFAVGLLGLYGTGRLLGCRALRDDI
jgi:exosortase